MASWGSIMIVAGLEGRRGTLRAGESGEAHFHSIKTPLRWDEKGAVTRKRQKTRIKNNQKNTNSILTFISLSHYTFVSNSEKNLERERTEFKLSEHFRKRENAFNNARSTF